MTRAEIAQRVRDLLEEESASVLTTDALRRMIDRGLAEATRRSRSIQVGLQIALTPGLSLYPAPEAGLGVMHIASDPAGSSVTIRGPEDETEYTYTWPTDIGTTSPTARAAGLLWADYTARRSLPCLMQGATLFFISPKPYFVTFSASSQTAVKTQVLPMQPVEVLSAMLVVGTQRNRLRRLTLPQMVGEYRQAFDASTKGLAEAYSTEGSAVRVYPTPSSSGTLELLVAYQHPAYPQNADGDALPLLLPERAFEAVSAYAAAEAAIRLRDREGTADLIAVFRRDFESWLSRAVLEDAAVHVGIASEKTMG